MSEINTFPNGFYWGASTSAHQVEGGNNNDWTEWEKSHADNLAEQAGPRLDYGNGPAREWSLIETQAKNPDNYLSGQAVDHYNRWRDDFDTARHLGLNAIRFSLEWSRIEPSPDVFDEKAIEHYAKKVRYAEEIGLTPFITTHHFTNPIWLQERGGFESSESVDRFALFLGRAVPQIATEANKWIVINEPDVYSGLGWMLGQWPPNKRNPLLYERVNRNLIEAHKRGYQAIKAHDDNAQVSSAVNHTHFEAAGGLAAPLNKAAANIGKRLLNRRFLNATNGEMDYIGLNNYFHCVIDRGLFKNGDEPRSDLGWYLNPASLYAVVKDINRYKKPVIITEHGLADSEDTRREWFITQSLKQVKQAVDEGVDVRGYLHWSLLDNFEWDKGFWPEFGLLKVDRSTMERTVRPSARAYGQIALQNGLAD